MGELFKNKKINSLFGILFQIPVFIIAAFGLYQLMEKFYYSLTDFNGLEKPVFIGLKNYFNLFKDNVPKIKDNVKYTTPKIAIVIKEENRLLFNVKR